MISAVDIAVVLSAVLLTTYLYHRGRRPLLPTPPGPKGLPLLGNIFDLPAKEQWITYRDMGLKYDSDIVYFNVPGMSLLVVNTAKVAMDLFERRHALYSGRPPFHMLSEVLGFGWHFPLMPDGKMWRALRTLFQQQSRPSKLAQYQKPCIVDSTHIFLNRLLDDPDNFIAHIRFLAGRTILSSSYGIYPENEDDPFLTVAEKANRGLSITGIPGSFIVDFIPILKYVPDWLPGVKFKKVAAEYAPSVRAVLEMPMEFVKKSMNDGSAKPSIASRYLQDISDEGPWTQEQEKMIGYVLATMYAAGSDTTTSTLGSVFLALVQHPDILKKGQMAVDIAVGSDRLPDFKDEHKIPYVDAIMKEALRWTPVLHLGVAHFLSTADVYNGYYIPANTVVIGNSWAILHDPAIYGLDTDIFRPERFLNADGTLNKNIPDPDAAFGYGRRTCAGKVMAQDALWLAIASVLACFDVTKAIMDDGSVVEPSGEYITGLLSTPAPFLCRISPRSKTRESLIRNNMDD